MEVRYFKGYSYNLNREMEFKVYGHRGKPVLFIPCQAGRFYDFENFHMDDVFRPYIDAGEIMVFSIDTIDNDLSFIDLPCAGNCIQHGRFTGSVTTDNSNKITFIQCEVQTVQSHFFIDGSRIKCFIYVFQLKHQLLPPRFVGFVKYFVFQ